MFIYFGRNFAAAQTGSVVRHVECEKCHCFYAYELVRRGTGSGTSPYMLNNAGAQRRADRRAAAQLGKQLRTGVDAVACPDCGWYAADMVREMRRRRLRPLVGIAIAAAVMAAFAAVIGGIVWLDRRRPWDAEAWLAYGGIVGGLLAVAGAAYGLRAAALRGLDPNRDYPVPPAPYPGAPLAIKLTGSPHAGPVAAAVETRSGRDGGVPTLGYQRQRPEILPGGWVTMQLAGSPFPKVCCRCGADTENLSVVNFDLAAVPVRMCRPCARREWWRVATWAAVSFVVAWGAVVTIAWTVKRGDTTGRLIVSVLLGPIAGLFAGVGGVIAARRGFGGPVRLRRFASQLNTIELWFRRTGYADLFVESAKRDATVRASGLSSWPATMPKGLNERQKRGGGRGVEAGR